MTARRLRRAIGLACMLFAIKGCTAERPLRSITTCSGVCGYVLDAGSGRPIDRFTVTLFSTDPRDVLQPAFTLPKGFPLPPGPILDTRQIDSSEGWFELPTVPSESFVVAISARGYAPVQTRNFSGDTGPLRITLHPARQIVLQVIDQRGEPLRGARIYYGSHRTIQDLRAGATPVPLATTARDGEASIDAPIADDVDLVVATDGYVSQPLRVAKDDARRTIALARSTFIAGSTRTFDGRSAPRAAVALRCGELSFFSQSDERGEFRIDGVPAEPCALSVGYGLIDEPTSGLLRVGEPSATLAIQPGSRRIVATLPAAGRLAGRLTGLEETNLGASVVARSRDRVVHFAANPQGRFGGRLASGVWELTGVFEDAQGRYTTEPKSIAIRADGDAAIELAFARPLVIRIVPSAPLLLPLRVRSTRPISDIDLTVSPVRNEYRIRGLPPGRYSGSIDVSGAELSFPISVPAADVLEFSLRLHTATVRISDRREPVRGSVTVLDWKAPAASPFRRSEVRRMVLGLASEGEYIGWNFPEGQYDIRVDAEGYVSQQASFELPGDVPEIVLDAIPNPFPHPPSPAALPPESLSVIEATLADVQRRAVRLRGGNDVEPTLLVASHTVRHPAVPGGAVGSREVRQQYETLSRGALLRQFRNEPGEVRSFEVAQPQARTIAFEALPLRRPAQWRHALLESDLIDVEGFFDVHPRTLAIALYTDVTFSRDRNSSLVLAELIFPGGRLPVLYVLERKSDGWIVAAAFDVLSEPGC